jgi:phage shock protein C
MGTDYYSGRQLAAGARADLGLDTRLPKPPQAPAGAVGRCNGDRVSCSPGGYVGDKFTCWLTAGIRGRPPTATTCPGPTERTTHMNSTDRTKVLVRSRKGRMVAGICAGAADYFGWDVTLVRVIVAVVSVITGGTGVLAYLVAWALIPEEGEKSSIAEDLLSKTNHSSPG